MPIPGLLKARLACVLVLPALVATAADFHPRAVPLVACDPYFSIWSTADRLTDVPTRHWTGAAQPLTSLIRIDGATYRLMGTDPRGIEPLPQTGVEVLPTRTLYDFEGHGVRVRLLFTTPALPRDLDVFSRPITYIAWEAKAADGRAHAVSIYFDASALIAVNTPDEEVIASRYRLGDTTALRVGTRQQAVLAKSGDDLRIDWGYLYLTAPPVPGSSSVIASHLAAAPLFAEKGALPDSDDLRSPEPAGARRNSPALAWSFDLGQVASAPVARHLVLAYDDLFSVEHFYRRLRPYWRRNGAEAQDLLRQSLEDYGSLAARCERFDSDLMRELVRAGGPKYAALAALAYRQAFAAQKLVADIDGRPLLFPKENTSNGCIGTVDVIYPASPLLLAMNPELLKASMTPLLEYAAMPRWPFPFAPHDLGTYPLANGQVYGGGEKTEKNQMPVEESANMILMAAAIARAEGNASYAARHWAVLERWAGYLRDKGLDPENQLSTDDFAGHLAHNANLSAKAILALGAYAQLCDRTGRTAEAARYMQIARQFVAQWMKLADDRDHYRLAFDKPGTWSQKYNLVWDKLLDLRLFPAEVARKEVAWYKGHANTYGLPLEVRSPNTKLDWLLWSATLADSQADFDALIAPAYRWAGESGSRVPLSDYYDTVTGKDRGMHARSVVGGLFVKLLASAPPRAQVHRFSTIMTAQDVRDRLSTGEGLSAAIDWCRKTGVSKVYIESFRDGYRAERDALLRAKERFSGAGFEVSGCVTTTAVGKPTGHYKPLSCYTDKPTQEKIRSIFEYAAGLFDETMIDDFWFTDCDCAECQAARKARTVTIGGRTYPVSGDTWEDYRGELMLRLSQDYVLGAARRVNPNARLIIKYPQWYDRFHERGYDVARETAAFNRIWVGTETRDRDKGGVPQYEGYFIMRWLGKLGGSKTGGGWYDPYSTTPRTYVEQARQTVLAGADESLLFCYGGLQQRTGPENVAALRENLAELQRVAEEVHKRKIVGIAAYKPPNSRPVEDGFIFDHLGMLGLPLDPCHEFPTDAPAAFFSMHALKDPDFEPKLKQFIATGRPVLVTDGLKRALKLDAPNVWALPGVKSPPADLDTFRVPLLRALKTRFEAPPQVALYLFQDGSWVIENFNDAEAVAQLNGKSVKLPARGWAYEWR